MSCEGNKNPPPRFRDGVNRGATLIGGKTAHLIGRVAGTIDSSSISSRVESDCWKVTGLHPPGFLETPQKFCSFIGLTYYDKIKGLCKVILISRSGRHAGCVTTQTSIAWVFTLRNLDCWLDTRNKRIEQNAGVVMAFQKALRHVMMPGRFQDHHRRASCLRRQVFSVAWANPRGMDNLKMRAALGQKFLPFG